jgi:glycosyltransferase involved in cell wall biosynthesis
MSNSRPDRRYPRILEVGPIPPPHAGWGVRIAYVLDGLRAGGVECAALDVGPQRTVKRPECDDVQSGWDYARKVQRYLRRGFRVHLHLNGQSLKGYILVIVATILCLVHFRPPVLTWHGGINQRWFPRRRNPLANFVNWFVFRMSSLIICNDDQIKACIVEYGVTADRVHAIPAFSRQYLNYETVPLPSEVEEFLNARSPAVFCYAVVRPEFYLSTLIEALESITKRHPRFGIVLVGCTDGHAGFTEGTVALRRDLEQRHLTDNVLFTGDLERNEFLTLLARADLCIRTPERDGVSSSVLEALALGVPVVAAANSLRPPQVHCYPATDSAQLAQVVCRVLEMSPGDRRPEPPEIADTVETEIALLTELEQDNLVRGSRSA